MKAFDKLREVCNNFLPSEGTYEIEDYGEGNVHKTRSVSVRNGRRYILQGINSSAFKNVPALMQNYVGITKWVERHLDPQFRTGDRRVQHIMSAKSGLPYYCDAEGNYWRMMDFIENTTVPRVVTPEVFESAGRAFGEFQGLVADFPVDQLFETIPNFHNTPARMRAFEESLLSDTCTPELKAECAEEIGFVFSRTAAMHKAHAKITACPMRVTHNDTKLNNILWDADTMQPLCVIDLDTVMPGYVAHDYGDAIRFGANVAMEDEPDLNKVRLDMELFESFTKGYCGAAKFLTKDEVETLPYGCLNMGIELGTRFLTDYFLGSVYFRTEYPEHNLVRARNQFALVKNMEGKFETMQQIAMSAR